MSFEILCALDLEKSWAAVIQEMLKREGYKVLLCRNCADEIFDIDLDQFNLLIIDPVMTGSRSDARSGGLPVGIHAARCLRENGCRVPIMAFADVGRKAFEELLDAGVDTVVDLKCYPETVNKYVLSAVERLIKIGWALR
ncbi:MAG: hypothetical protein WCW77_02425 [Patescibacteria group bacterium]|jgi:CheY-like chemotaxis protein